jgi:hypothetical protein
VLRCYGFGFIRAISPEKRMLYVVSPISSEDCAKIDVLFVPNRISTPELMFDREVSGSVFEPQLKYASLFRTPNQPPIWSRSRAPMSTEMLTKNAVKSCSHYNRSSPTTPAFAAQSVPTQVTTQGTSILPQDPQRREHETEL